MASFFDPYTFGDNISQCGKDFLLFLVMKEEQKRWEGKHEKWRKLPVEIYLSTSRARARATTPSIRLPSSPDTEAGKPRINGPGTKTEEPKIVTPSLKCPDDSDIQWPLIVPRHGSSKSYEFEVPDSPGTKAEEEPKIVTPSRKRPSNSGIQGGVVKRPKWPLIVARNGSSKSFEFEGPNSPGLKVEEPNNGPTSPQAA